MFVCATVLIGGSQRRQGAARMTIGISSEYLKPGTASRRRRLPSRRPDDLWKVPEWVRRRSVDADLEVQVVAEAASGAADVTDHLALAYRVADAGRVAGLVRVARREAAAVIDAGVVAVPAGVGGEDRAARLRGANRRPARDPDVDALVHPSPAPTEGRGDRAVDGPDQPRRALAALDRTRRQRRRRGRGRRLDLGLDPVLDVGDVALEALDVVVDLVQRRGLLVAHRVELGLAGLELRAGAHELGLLGGDAVAVVLDSGDGVAGLVAQSAHAPDDRRVLLLDAAQVLIAAEQVIEAVGLEDHGEHVGLVGAVDLDQAMAQYPERGVQVAMQPLEPVLGAHEARLDAAQLGDHGGLTIAQHGHLTGELVDLGPVALDLGRENALLLLLGIELRALVFELGVQVLGTGGRDERERDGEQRRRRKQRRDALAGRGLCAKPHRSFHR